MVGPVVDSSKHEDEENEGNSKESTEENPDPTNSSELDFKPHRRNFSLKSGVDPAVNQLEIELQKLDLKETIPSREENETRIPNKFVSKDIYNNGEGFANNLLNEGNKEIIENRESEEEGSSLIERGPIVNSNKQQRPQPYIICKDISTRRFSYPSGGTCIENAQISPEPYSVIIENHSPSLEKNSLKQTYTHKAGGEVTVNPTLQSSSFLDINQIVSPNVSRGSSPSYSNYSDNYSNPPSIQQTVPRSPPDFAASPESFYSAHSPLCHSESMPSELTPDISDFILDYTEPKDNGDNYNSPIFENQSFDSTFLQFDHLGNSLVGNNNSLLDNGLFCEESLQQTDDQQRCITVLNNYCPLVVQERYQQQTPSPMSDARNSPNILEEINNSASILTTLPVSNGIISPVSSDTNNQIVPDLIPTTVFEMMDKQETTKSKGSKKAPEPSKLPSMPVPRRTRTQSGVSTDTVLSFSPSGGGNSPTLSFPGNTSVVLVISPGVTASPPKFVPIAPKPPPKSTSPIEVNPKSTIEKITGVSERYNEIKSSILKKYDIELRKKIHLLVTKFSNADLGNPDEDGDTLLHNALKDSAADERAKIMAVYLIDRYRAVKELNINAVNKFGLTPLSCSIECKDLNVMKLLLECGADPNSYIGGFQKPLLHYLAERSNKYLQHVELLSQYPRFKVDAFNGSGETALMVAIESEGKKISTANGINGTINSLPMIELLLKVGAKVDVQCLKYGKTAFHYAVEKMHVQALELLCQNCAEGVNIKNFNQVVPLDVALSLNGPDLVKHKIVKLLIDSGTSKKDINDKKALQAILKKNKQI